MFTRLGVSSSGDCGAPVMGDLERGEGLVALPRIGSFTGLPDAAGDILPDSTGGGVDEDGTRRPVLSPLLVRE